MGTIKDYLQPSPIEKYFAHHDMWEKYFSINNRFVNQNVMTALKPLQIAMQPYLNMMSIAQSANNAMIASMTSLDRIATGFKQLQQVHKVMQPMAEYSSLLESIEPAFSSDDFTELLTLNEEIPPLEEFSSFESKTKLLPGEIRLVELFIKNEKLLTWFRAHYPKLSNATVEDAQIFIFWLIFQEIVLPYIKSAIKG